LNWPVKRYLFLTLGFFGLILFEGCNPVWVTNPFESLNYSSPFSYYSPDSLILTLQFPIGSTSSPRDLTFTYPSTARICSTLWIHKNASLTDTVFYHFTALSSSYPRKYILDQLNRNSSEISLLFHLDTTLFVHLRDSLLNNTKTQRIRITNFSTPQLPDSFRLLLPCEGVPVPSSLDLLPNAPRNYRNGIHRGIDFLANWGTPVRAVAQGVVIFANHHFKENSTEIFNALLNEAHDVGFTPADIYFFRLLGKSVVIDHGLNMLPGYRVVSIYAHLSHIPSTLQPGDIVKAGQIIGSSGNTGTEPATHGSRNGAHLHWEMVFQNSAGEIYLGQGIPDDILHSFLHSIFSSSASAE